MFKKLDKLILRAYVGPFIATFMISLFVLVMQFFWLYIDDLVGKGLDLWTILTLVGYVAATTVPMALPLAILLSSIMTFGNLGESFELVAIKSAGIPLLRFMRPLLVVTIMLSGVAFLFSNYVIPVVQLKLNRLKYDIIVAKPAFNIKEGIFYDQIPGFVIKLGKKDADNKSIHEVIIFDKKNELQDNLMLAKDGHMEISGDKKTLIFQLKHGVNYEESGSAFDTATQYTRMSFREYNKNFDLSEFEMQSSNEEGFKSNPQMMSFRQLLPAIDSIKTLERRSASRGMREMGYNLVAYQYADSTVKSKKAVRLPLLSDSVKDVLADRIFSSFQAAKVSAENIQQELSGIQLTERKHEIEMYLKFTLSAACIVLFLIGAPLGSIIRKGGLGTPLIFAVIFFSLFYVLNTIGKNISEQGVVRPIVGMWLSTMVLLPVGIFLTVKAMRDSQLFNAESWFRIGKIIKKYWPFGKKKLSPTKD